MATTQLNKLNKEYWWTQAAFDAAYTAGTLEVGAIYHITDKEYVETNTAITGSTKAKITYDSKGLVTAGADLEASDIPSLTLTKISDVTATASEVNVLDGITATTAELNYVDGVTSNIQTQIDAKSAVSVSSTGTSTDTVSYITIDGTEKKLADSSLNGAVRYDIAQSLSASEKAQALENIGASSVSVSATGTSVTQVNYITIDGTEYLLGDGGTTTWDIIQANVQNGYGATAYPVGTQFQTTHSVLGTIIWEVVGHDQIGSATGKTHTMSLLSLNVLQLYQYDSAEAAIACDTALVSGTTYHFTNPSNSTVYQFTPSVNCPVGTQLVPTLSDYIITALTPYAKGSITALGSAFTVTEGSSGTGIPSTSVNHHLRFRYGSNNYKESAIRQYMNSDSAAGTYWTPKTKYDRPPSWNSSLAGFKAGLPSDFLSVVDTAIVKCSANNTFESQDSTVTKNTAYEVSDMFFPASRMEVFGSSDVADGSVQMTWFVGASNLDRIKMRNNAAQYWRLRTPTSNNACGVRVVYTDGSLDNDGAYYSFGFVPTCIIA